MEKEIFTWQGWDTFDEGGYYFYNVVLNADVKDIPAGTKFDTAAVDFQRGTLEFSNAGEFKDGYAPLKDNRRFKLGLVVGDEIIAEDKE